MLLTLEYTMELPTKRVEPGKAENLQQEGKTQPFYEIHKEDMIIIRWSMYLFDMAASKF